MALKLLTAVALVGGAGWIYTTQDAWSRGSFIQAAAGLWLVELFLYTIYELFLYPKFFSPLRHVPTAPGGHWLLGHGKQVLASKPGAPLREW